jgi:hypothetical protein
VCTLGLQAIVWIEFKFGDQNVFYLQLALIPRRGSWYRDPLDWPFGPAMGAFFFGHLFHKLFILQLAGCTLSMVWAHKPAILCFIFLFQDIIMYAHVMAMC